MATLIENIITEKQRQILCNYLATVDERSDVRPDVTSKHPRWDIDKWPQDIISQGLQKVFPNGYEVSEVTFYDTKIGLKLHTDNASIDGTQGKTVLFLLDADPEAQTVFFDNYNAPKDFGEHFTKQKWSPFQYKLPNKHGQLTYVEDLRKLLEQCKINPESVEDFVVDKHLIHLIEHTIEKRSNPRDVDSDVKQKKAGHKHAARTSDYSVLTNYDETKTFPKDIHEKYLFNIPYEDLVGLKFNKVLDWKLSGAIVFDREMLHASSSCHSRKKFITVFAHSL